MRLIETEIRELKYKALDMAELVLMQLDDVISAISSLDLDLVKKIRKKEKKIDKYDIKIDRRCERILALYQPVANDLRFVTTVLKINAYMEQIGDIISGIARKLLEIHQDFDAEFLTELRLTEMMQRTRHIVSESLMAFFKEDLELAKGIFEQDDEIDLIHRNAFTIITSGIQQTPVKCAEYIQMLLIIKGLEKIADFAVGISEEAMFQIEGVIYRHNEMKTMHRESNSSSTMQA